MEDTQMHPASLFLGSFLLGAVAHAPASPPRRPAAPLVLSVTTAVDVRLFSSGALSAGFSVPVPSRSFVESTALRSGSTDAAARKGALYRGMTSLVANVRLSL